MKRTIFTSLLSMTACICLAIGLSACEKTDKVEDVWTIERVYAEAQSMGFAGTLDELIAMFKGADGQDGLNGDEIESVSFDEDGNLILHMKSGRDVNCGNIPNCNHSYSAWETGLAPTCTSIGYDARTCTECGDTEYRFTAETGHNWDDGEVFKEATTEKGLKFFTCIECGMTKAEVIPALFPKFNMPIDYTSYIVYNDEIYHNNTLGYIYKHSAVHFYAEPGADIYSVADGTVVAITYNEKSGNSVAIAHGRVIAYYSLVEPAAELTAGSTVTKGQKIGELAQRYGKEAFEEAHMCFEVYEVTEDSDSTARHIISPSLYFPELIEDKNKLFS